jgi:raffinose/stachyose/melibiose transport system substrate-binding protein
MLPIGLNYSRLDNGKLYSLAWENNIEYIWYHKELFAKAGITKTPETFDELLQVCQKLKDAGIAPISMFTSGWPALRWMAFIPFRLTGNEFIENLKKGKAKMSDPVGIQTAEFFQKLAMNYFMPGWATSDYTNALETFLSGNAAMYYIGSWQFYSFMDGNRELKDDYDFFYMPTIKGAINGKTDMWAHAGTGTSISKANFDDVLKDFIKFLLDTYPETAFYEAKVMPPMTFDTTLGKLSGFDQQVMNDGNSLTSYGYCWDVRLDTATNEVMTKEVANLGMGQITPQEFANRIDAAIAENAPKIYK